MTYGDPRYITHEGQFSRGHCGVCGTYGFLTRSMTCAWCRNDEGRAIKPGLQTLELAAGWRVLGIKLIGMGFPILARRCFQHARDDIRYSRMQRKPRVLEFDHIEAAERRLKDMEK